MIKSVYLCGPMRNVPLYNFPAFDAAEKALQEKGYVVYSPARIDREFGFDPIVDPSAPEPALTECVLRDIEAIMLSDAVVKLPNCEQSIGAQAEIAVAKWLRKPVYPLEVILQGTKTWPAGEKRTFSTGATRDTDADKPDYFGFFSSLVMKRYGEYMLSHRKQSDGSLRDSDNWKKGIPQKEYVRSLNRHVNDLNLHFEGFPKDAREDLQSVLCAILFNVQGLLFEVLSDQRSRKNPEIPKVDMGLDIGPILRDIRDVRIQLGREHA